MVVNLTIKAQITLFYYLLKKGQRANQNSPAGQYPNRNISGLPYDPYQNYGDITSPRTGQPRRVSASSPSHFPPGIRPSLSTSSSPLHHSEYHTDEKRLLYQQQYGYNTPMRNQDSQNQSSHSYSQQQIRPQMRQHPHQRRTNREGGVYYNLPQQPGRQTVMTPPHYAQGKHILIIFLRIN